MGLDTLLATMERRVNTPATPCTHAGVTAKPAPVKACTLVTPATPQNGNTAPFDQEWFEERAAILEYDAGYPRCEAERLAYMEVTLWQQQLRCRTLQ